MWTADAPESNDLNCTCTSSYAQLNMVPVKKLGSPYTFSSVTEGPARADLLSSVEIELIRTGLFSSV